MNSAEDLIQKILEYSVVSIVGVLIHLNKKLNDIEKRTYLNEKILKDINKLATKQDIEYLSCRIKEVIEETRSCNNYERGGKK